MTQSKNTEKDDTWVRQVCDLIDACDGSAPTLSDLGQAVRLSPYHGKGALNRRPVSRPGNMLKPRASNILRPPISTPVSAETLRVSCTISIPPGFIRTLGASGHFRFHSILRQWPSSGNPGGRIEKRCCCRFSVSAAPANRTDKFSRNRLKGPLPAVGPDRE